MRVQKIFYRMNRIHRMKFVEENPGYGGFFLLFFSGRFIVDAVKVFLA